MAGWVVRLKVIDGGLAGAELGFSGSDLDGQRAMDGRHGDGFHAAPETAVANHDGLGEDVGRPLGADRHIDRLRGILHVNPLRPIDGLGFDREPDPAAGSTRDDEQVRGLAGLVAALVGGDADSAFLLAITATCAARIEPGEAVDEASGGRVGTQNDRVGAGVGRGEGGLALAVRAGAALDAEHGASGHGGAARIEAEQGRGGLVPLMQHDVRRESHVGRGVAVVVGGGDAQGGAGVGCEEVAVGLDADDEGTDGGEKRCAAADGAAGGVSDLSLDGVGLVHLLKRGRDVEDGLAIGAQRALFRGDLLAVIAGLGVAFAFALVADLLVVPGRIPGGAVDVPFDEAGADGLTVVIASIESNALGCALQQARSSGGEADFVLGLTIVLDGEVAENSLLAGLDADAVLTGG